jgi:hypothetical protein
VPCSRHAVFQQNTKKLNSEFFAEFSRLPVNTVCIVINVAYSFVRYDILAAVSIKNTVFLDVTPPSLVDKYQLFLGGRCFRLKGNLRMEAALSSWKSVTNLQTAQCQVPEYRNITVLLDSTMYNGS